MERYVIKLTNGDFLLSYGDWYGVPAEEATLFIGEKDAVFLANVIKEQPTIFLKNKDISVEVDKVIKIKVKIEVLEFLDEIS